MITTGDAWAGELLFSKSITLASSQNRKWRLIMVDQGATPRGKAFNLESYVEYADGSVVSKTLMKKEIGNITLFAFDKDQGLSEHTAPFDAVVQILDGTAEITIGGQPQIVNAGEMLIMPANISHALQATEKFKMLLVMIRSD
jgi:quercetin dioxygenase-like cupin family protein